MLNAAIIEDEKLGVTKSWIKRLEKITTLFENNHRNIKTDNDIRRLQKNMKESYIKYWKKTLGDEQAEEGRLYLYRKIKTNFNIEPYLKHIRKF